MEKKEHKQCHRGWFNGIFCSSSWELAFVVYCYEHNQQVSRCKQILTYIFDDKELRYFPDFEVDGVIYEIKGVQNRKSKAKQAQHPEVVHMFQKDLKMHFDYVNKKYGEEYWKVLYN